MALADALMGGLKFYEALSSQEQRAEAAQEQVKLVKAQAAGLAAEAQLKRQGFELALAHQARLAQALAPQGQTPAVPPPPIGLQQHFTAPAPGPLTQTDLPNGQPPASANPQGAQLRQAFSPQDVPPMPTYSPQTGVSVAPTPDQVQRGFVQKMNGTDLQGQQQAFVRQYGPTAVPSAPPSGAPSLPQDTTSSPGETADTSVPRVRATDALGGPRGSAVQQPVVTSPTATAGLPPLDMADDTMLRNLSRVFFLDSKPEPALRLWGYADEQLRLRQAGHFYRAILQNPQASDDSRRQATAGLGALLIQSAKVDEAVKLMMPYVPLSVRESVEKASAGTRDILLEQTQRGEVPNLTTANQEAQRRKVEVSAAQGSAGVRSRLTAEQDVKRGLTLQEAQPTTSERFLDTQTGRPVNPVTLYRQVEEQQRLGLTKRVTVDQAKKLESIQEALPIVQRIGEYTDLIYGPGGVLSEITSDPNSRQLLGTKIGIEQLTQRYPILTAAQRYMEANAEGLARALQGVRGAGTEEDVKRALGGLPKLSTTLSFNVWPPKLDYTLPDTRGVALRLMNDYVTTLDKVTGSILGNPQFQHEGLTRYQTAEQTGRPGKPDQPVTGLKTLPSGEVVKVPHVPLPASQAPAPTRRSAPLPRNPDAAMLPRLSPESILQTSDEFLEGIDQAEDVEGLNPQQTNALRLRLARRNQQRR